MTATAAPARTRLGAKRLDSWRAAWQNKGVECVTNGTPAMVTAYPQSVITYYRRAARGPFVTHSTRVIDGQCGAASLRPRGGSERGAG